MKSIVQQLQEEALEPSVAVGDLLRKAFLVAKKLSLEEFQVWAESELNGYSDGSVVPEYRIVVGRIKAFNPYRGWIPAIFESEEELKALSRAPIGQSISEVEDLVRKAQPGSSLRLPLPHAVQRSLNQNQRVEMELNLHVTPSTLVGILNTVRNSVLKWALQLEEDGILGEGLSFSTTDKKKAAASEHNIVNNFYGNVSQSQIAQHSPHAVQVVNEHPSTEDLLAFVLQVRESINQIELDRDARNELETDLQTIELQANSPRPKWAIIEQAGLSLQRIFEGAAGGAAAPVLLDQLRTLFGF